MSEPKSWRDVLPVHPAADLFPMMPPDELAALAADIKAHGLREKASLRVLAYGKFELLDGRNRLDALERLGWPIIENRGPTSPPIKYEYAQTVGDRASSDPVAFVFSANIHRRHLDAEQKRGLIVELLKLDAGKSNRQIAKAVGVSHNTVSSVRADLEGRGQIDHVSTRKDTKGRKQPAHRAPREKPEPFTDASFAEFDYRNAASDFTRAAENLLSMTPVRMFAALSEARQQRLVTILTALDEWANKL